MGRVLLAASEAQDFQFQAGDLAVMLRVACSEREPVLRYGGGDQGNARPHGTRERVKEHGSALPSVSQFPRRCWSVLRKGCRRKILFARLSPLWSRRV